MINKKHQKYKYKYFFFSSIFYKFLNKFRTNGNYKIESVFENYLYSFKLKKKINFFLIFSEVLVKLKPEVGVKIFKFSRNKNVKRRKKGSKLELRTKVIPIYINKKIKYNLALKFLVMGMKKNSGIPWKKKFNKELFNIIKNKKIWINSEKARIRKLILINRGSAHYRW